MRLALAFLALGAILGAQDPQHLVAVGGSYSSTASPHTDGWASYDTQTSPGFYWVTTFNLRSAGSSARTGLAKELVHTGNTWLFAFVDAGAATMPTSTTAAFSGGGALVYDLAGLVPKWKGKGYVAVFAVRELVAGGATKPQYEFGFGRSF